MKKVSSAAVKAAKNFSPTEVNQRLGPGRSFALVIACWTKRATGGASFGVSE